MKGEGCHNKFGSPPPLFLFPPVHILFRNPGPYISEMYGPPCMLSTIAEIQKSQGLGSGYEWLAGLVSRVCMAGLVFRVRIFRGSKYHVTGHTYPTKLGCDAPSCLDQRSPVPSMASLQNTPSMTSHLCRSSQTQCQTYLHWDPS